MGRIAYWPAWVEMSLEWVTLELMRELGPARRAITRGRSAGQLIELCRSLIQEGVEAPVGLDASLAMAKAALERRNQVLHSAIGGALMLPGEERLVALWGRKGSSRVVHENEFDSVAEDLFQASQALGPYI